MAKSIKRQVGYFKVTAHKDKDGKFYRSLWVELPGGGTVQICGNGSRCEVTSYAVDRVDFRHSKDTEATIKADF